MSVRHGGCAHPQVSDAQVQEREDLIAASWGGASPIKCPDCNEYLYPHGEGEDLEIYAGEPFGAGADPAGRPDPFTHPEYWRE